MIFNTCSIRAIPAIDEADVRKLFLPPYQAAVKAGAGSVMASFSSRNGKKMHDQKSGSRMF